MCGLSVDGEAEAPVWPPVVDAPAVQLIAHGEVVMLEWLDDETLLYGSRLRGERIHRAGLAALRSSPIMRCPRLNIRLPRRVTAEMIERSDAALITQSGEQNPALFYSSRMTFPPTGAARGLPE